MANLNIISSLVDEYHSNPDRFSEDQAHRIALLAFENNIPFEPETKKLKKFGFDVADTALFGMLPNKWRPKRVAEDLYGESAGEEISGALGTLLGLVPAGMGAGALIKGGFKRAKGLFGKSGKKGGGGGVSNANQHVAQLPQGTSLLQLSSGANRIGAGAKRLNPAQKQLNPYNPVDNIDDYLNTAMNQAYSKHGISQPF
jgi:hypothetical protein